MRLIGRVSRQQGTLTQVSESYRDTHMQLRDAFVKACLIVIDTYTATKLIRAGRAAGWRFRCRKDDHVALWAPPTGWRPITYTVRNAVLWRAVKAHKNMREEL